MRAAYLRALNYIQDFKIHECNACGKDNDSIGDYLFINAGTSKLRIWNCQGCINEEEKEEEKIFI